MSTFEVEPAASSLEGKVLSSARRGEVCRCGDEDPELGPTWGPERTLPAERIYQLCCGTADLPIHPKGVRIEGARIEGSLDLEDATLRCPLHLLSCYLPGKLCLDRARVKSLVLSGSRVAGLSAEGMVSSGEVGLDDGFWSDGMVNLRRAHIATDLICSGGRFHNPGQIALFAGGLQVGGGIFLDHGFISRGTTQLLGAKVGCNLECDGGTFDSPGAVALNCEQLQCRGSVFLRHGFSSRGEVSLMLASIGGSLDCRGGPFISHNGNALACQGLTCRGEVCLRRPFAAEGRVNFISASIGGSFDASGGQIRGSEGEALQAGRLHCRGSVLIGNGFSAHGRVCFNGTTIELSLSATGGHFYQGGADQADKAAFELRNASIGQSLYFDSVSFRPGSKVNLRGTRVAAFQDDAQSWEHINPGNLYLDGFQYARIEPPDAEARLSWLRKAEFSPQPYTQLADCLRRQGHEPEALEILVEKERDRWRHGKDPLWKKLLWRLLGFFVGYGYRPVRALLWLALCWIIGGIVFTGAYRGGAMAPSDPDVMSSASWLAERQLPDDYVDYPQFRPWLYSFDTVVPVVNLHMEEFWGPSLGPASGAVPSRWAWVAWWYLRFHIFAGWVLSTLAVLGFSGLIRRD